MISLKSSLKTKILKFNKITKNILKNKLIHFVLLIIILIGTFYFGRLQFIHERQNNISSPEPFPEPSPIESLSPKSDADKILRQHSSYQCPDIFGINNWMNKVVGTTDFSKNSDKLKNDDSLLWACYVYYEEEYKSYNKIINTNTYESPSSSPIKSSPQSSANEIDLNQFLKHSTCDSNGRCIQVNGSGSDECSIDRHCKHTECRNFECVSVPGKGDDKCSFSMQTISDDTGHLKFFDTDCGHSECQNNQCIILSGKGNNQCTDYSTCKNN